MVLARGSEHQTKCVPLQVQLEGDLARSIELGKQEVHQAVAAEEGANAEELGKGVSGLEGLLGSVAPALATHEPRAR